MSADCLFNRADDLQQAANKLAVFEVDFCMYFSNVISGLNKS